VIVKICGITNREDALAAAEAGASALGFVFYPPSPRAVTPEAAAAIAEVLPRTIWKVGVFVNESSARIAAVAAAVGLDVVQLVGQAVPPVPRLRTWRALSVGPDFTLAQLDTCPEAEAFLLDTAVAGHYGGTGQSFPWEVARGATRKVILAGGLHAGNVREAIRAARPWGVDASSSLESAPGRKDHARVAAFIAAARAEAQS
jgi:phosphoribosylanthranilate isomerase